jgi:hypothetical protein
MNEEGKEQWEWQIEVRKGNTNLIQHQHQMRLLQQLVPTYRRKQLERVVNPTHKTQKIKRMSMMHITGDKGEKKRLRHGENENNHHSS